MTDKKDELPGFDKEIEDMDQFLEQQEEEFPIVDDEDVDNFAPPEFEEPKAEVKKRSAGKKKKGLVSQLFTYAVFLGALGGVGYAGVVYAPKLINQEQMDWVQGYVQEGGQNLMGTVANQTQNVIDDNTEPQNLVPEPQMADTLPMPSDSEVNDLVGDVEDTSLVAEEPAETIADALAIAQQAPEPEELFPDVPTETTEQSPSEDFFDQIPSAPMVSEDEMVQSDDAVDQMGVMITEDASEQEEMPEDGIAEAKPAPSMDEETQIVEEMPSAEIAEVEEILLDEEPIIEEGDILPEVVAPSQNGDEVEPMAVEAEIASVEEVEEEILDLEEDNATVEQNEPTQEVDTNLENDVTSVDVTTEENDIQATPDHQEMNRESVEVEATREEVEIVEEETKPIDVDQIVAQPVVQADKIPSAPKAPKPVKREDPRVEQARNAFERQNFQQALTLYQAILADDPANTAALTGRQLSQAKLRMQNQQVAPTFTPSPQSPSMQSSGITVLLQQARQNPRSARTALNVADAYKAMNDVPNAMNWYRKALQLDVMNSSGLDRMAIYDSMAELQQ